MNRAHHALDDMGAVDSVGVRRVVEHDAMRQRGGRNRLDVSIALQDKRYGEYAAENRRPRSLRKQRSEGRLLFIVLVIALALAIIWITTHLHF